MMAMAFTKPQREKLARAAEKLVQRETGQDTHFEPDPDYPSELHLRLPKFETVNGPFAWAHFEVCPRGMSIHIRFEDIERAKPNCYGINPFSGKWNHYFWPTSEVPQTERAAAILRELAWVLNRLRPAHAEAEA